ncbi:SoxR-reducing system protein RseC [Budvicia diplopodorum]|uniref:SoxR-reducing system protein RseC n=1 Tax=Budvicia diplopodorum TaxID=1119056 RepID=UPI00135BDBDB|nr:SoxR-reducing system protein RseC [Budvicia diplopodorum]
MLREWATVVDWQNGVATLRCEQRAGCSSCQSSSTCGTRVLNKLGPQVVHDLHISVEQPLSVGQRVELGIPESGVLLSALLVYMLPLLGILLFSSLLYYFLGSDLAAVFGTIVGGLLGFWVARFYAERLSTHVSVHPIILQIAIPSVAHAGN